jgi:hypothetical protein
MSLRGDRGLRREIGLVLGAKVLALGALWWLFFRGHQVPVDARLALDRLQPAAAESAAFPAAAHPDRGRSDAR